MGGIRGETETEIKRIVCLTNILETNSARCVVKVHAADFQRIQLCNVMPAHLHTVQSNFRSKCVTSQKLWLRVDTVVSDVLADFYCLSTHETLRKSEVAEPTATTATQWKN